MTDYLTDPVKAPFRDRGGRHFDLRAFDPTPGSTDKLAALNAAIEAAADAGGGDVYLSTMASFSAPPTLASGVNLIGHGRESGLVALGSFKLLDFTGITGVRVHNLTLNGQQTTEVSSQHLVHVPATSSDIEIAYCWLLNARGNGVNVAGGSNVRVLFNKILQAARHGVYLEDATTDILVEGNYIIAPGTNGTTGDSGKGIAIHSPITRCDRVRVIGNYVKDARQVSYEFWGGTGGQGGKWLTVTANICENLTVGPSKFGISFDRCSDFACVGNVVRGTGIALESAGCHYGTFVGNTVEDCTSIGVSVSANSTNIIVDANTVKNPGSFGIQFFQSTNFTCTANRVTGGASRGIFINSCGSDSSFVLEGNAVTGCVTSGIYLNATDGGVVSGNVSIGNNTSAAGGELSGIYVNVSGSQSPDKILFGQNWTDGSHIVADQRITRGTAAPTAGTHRRGDWHLNTTPSAGGPVLWVCTAAGSPGTWTPINVGAIAWSSLPTDNGTWAPGTGKTISLDSAVRIGTATTDINSLLLVERTPDGTGATQVGVHARPVFNASALNARAVYASVHTVASALVLTSATAFYAANPSLGAGASATTAYGLLVETITAGGTNWAIFTNGTTPSKFGGKLLTTGGLGVGNSAAASTPGAVVKKMEVFDANGTSLGFVPIYDSIT